MIEAGANEVDEDTMLRPSSRRTWRSRSIIEFINRSWPSSASRSSTSRSRASTWSCSTITAEFMDESKAAMDTDDKNVRERALERCPSWTRSPRSTPTCRRSTWTGQLQDAEEGRQEVAAGGQARGWPREERDPSPGRRGGVLPRVHGSGLFTRGQTQVLSVCTLDTLSANQKLDTIWEETEKRYMHHYNFPPTPSARPAHPQPRPPRDRPRRTGRACSGARHSLRGGVPLRHPLRVRGAVLQRLHLSGLHLRLYAGPDGRRRAHQGSRCRHLLRPDHRRATAG